MKEESYLRISKLNLETQNEEEIHDDRIADLEDMLSQASRFDESKVPEGVKKGLERLQEAKLETMSKLKEELNCIRNDEDCLDTKKDSREIVFDDESKMFTWNGFNATFGDLEADLHWKDREGNDIEYNLQPSMFSDKEDKKKLRNYILAKRKNEIIDNLERQIITCEYQPRQRGAMIKNMKSKKGFPNQISKSDRAISGKIAEEIAFTAALRLIRDYDLSMEIRKADIYDDTIQGIDFIVEHREGMDENQSGFSKTGIQFANVLRGGNQTNRDRERIHKMHIKKGTKVESLNESKSKLRELQIDKADKIVTDFIAYRAYNRWDQNKRPPGGPSRFLYPKETHDLFNQLIFPYCRDEYLDDVPYPLDSNETNGRYGLRESKDS